MVEADYGRVVHNHGQEILSFLPFIIDNLQVGMSDDNEFRSRLTNGGPSFCAMDEAFCARMRKAIEAGLESGPIAVVTTPGTKKPKLLGRYAALPSSLPTTLDS